jgi:single-stranded DNA-binding protein
MNPITVTVTGRLGDDPRSFSTNDGTAGVELRLAIDLPARNGDNITRWVKVNAYGVLASRTADSVRKGDRVTVIAEDLLAEAWITKDDQPQARGRVSLRAREIAASMAYDSLRTGYADRKAARQAAANGEPNDLPAAEQADARVLAGVTTSS